MENTTNIQASFRIPINGEPSDTIFGGSKWIIVGNILNTRIYGKVCG